MSTSCLRSRYNYVVSHGDAMIAYNARTGAFAEVSSEVAAYLNAEHDRLSTADEQSLLELGFLHRGDELEQVIQTYQNSKPRSTLLGLTIAPTLACNKACPYCYQNEYRNKRVMSPETQAATLRYVSDRVAAGWREVSCTWYGGEPLLAVDIVEQMSIELRHIVEAGGGILYPIGIITNATLLDQSTLRRLVQAGIEFAQISFDALVDRGAASRGVLTPTGEPSVILQNAKAASEQIRISLRINVNRSNASELPKIRSVLQEHGLDQYVYLARTSDLDGESGCFTKPDGQRKQASPSELSRVHLNEDVMTRPEFARLEQNSFLADPSHYQSLVARLTPRTQFCGATQGTLFVIDPAGDISRCWNSAGVAAEQMGSVYEVNSDMSNREVARKWDEISPFLYPSCASCNVLPLCMGGCAHSRVFMGDKRSPCESIKYQIHYAVQTIAQIIRLPQTTNQTANQTANQGDDYAEFCTTVS